MAVVDEEKPEITHSCSFENTLVGLVILSKPAGSAGAGGNENVPVPDLLNPLLFYSLPQEAGEVACGEYGGTARPRIDKLLPYVQIHPFNLRQGFCPVTSVFEDRLHELLVLPPPS